MQMQKMAEEPVIAVLMKWFDWPPVLTVACVLAVWAISRFTTPSGLALGLWALVPLVFGVAAMAAAAVQMARARTPLNPRTRPQVLVTTGIFRVSRNPIYLGDALVILAAVLWWDAPLGLLVLGGFLWIATYHYIAREEGWLLDKFGDRARVWFSQTRRWI